MDGERDWDNGRGDQLFERKEEEEGLSVAPPPISKRSPMAADAAPVFRRGILVGYLLQQLGAKRGIFRFSFGPKSLRFFRAPFTPLSPSIPQTANFFPTSNPPFSPYENCTGTDGRLSKAVSTGRNGQQQQGREGWIGPRIPPSSPIPHLCARQKAWLCSDRGRNGTGKTFTTTFGTK